MLVPTADATKVVVHDLGGTGRPLILSHATGFHGHCYAPIADALADRMHAWAPDYPGHGDTPWPDDDDVVDWVRYGDDARMVAAAVAPGGGVVGFGHSMGGAALLMAARDEPQRFDVIVAYEPVIIPPEHHSLTPAQVSLADVARRRRATFGSFEAAYANYASKPPMNAFDPRALHAYVDHGFAPTSDGVTLKCTPEHEARTFEAFTHRLWDDLPSITTRVVVVRGDPSSPGPAGVADAVADRLPNGTLLALEHLDHFGPMTHPTEIAEVIAAAAGS